MSDTLGITGSVQITISHDGIDQIINGPNAISTECYNYLLNCMVSSSVSVSVISNMMLYYNSTISSTIVSVSKSRPTERSAQFRATISSSVTTFEDVWQARLITSGSITYSTYSLPYINVPTGYTMSIDWTISAP